MGLVEHILRTTAPDSPHRKQDQEAWRAAVTAFCRDVRFVKLSILDAPAPETDEGVVLFRAELRDSGRDVSFEELSRFVRVDGGWFYDRAITDR
jgi:uncharacterized protein YchJ